MINEINSMFSRFFNSDFMNYIKDSGYLTYFIYFLGVLYILFRMNSRILNKENKKKSKVFKSESLLFKINEIKQKIKQNNNEISSSIINEIAWLIEDEASNNESDELKAIKKEKLLAYQSNDMVLYDRCFMKICELKEINYNKIVQSILEELGISEKQFYQASNEILTMDNRTIPTVSIDLSKALEACLYYLNIVIDLSSQPEVKLLKTQDNQHEYYFLVMKNYSKAEDAMFLKYNISIEELTHAKLKYEIDKNSEYIKLNSQIQELLS